jgi:hypothetical protein
VTVNGSDEDEVVVKAGLRDRGTAARSVEDVRAAQVHRSKNALAHGARRGITTSRAAINKLLQAHT